MTTSTRREVGSTEQHSAIRLYGLLSPEKKALLEWVWNMPWIMKYELHRLLLLPWFRLLFAWHGIRWGRRWRVWGMPVIQRHRGSLIEIGDGLQLRSWVTTNPLAPNRTSVLSTRKREAVIRIGRDAGLTGVTIVAAERVEIGARVLIGANSTIVDTDFHPLDPVERERDILAGRHQPVIIEDDVFIGMNSMILKGVTIGRAAVVGAGSVVTRDVLPSAIVAGNPARVVGALDSAELPDGTGREDQTR